MSDPINVSDVASSGVGSLLSQYGGNSLIILSVIGLFIAVYNFITKKSISTVQTKTKYDTLVEVAKPIIENIVKTEIPKIEEAIKQKTEEIESKKEDINVIIEDANKKMEETLNPAAPVDVQQTADRINKKWNDL